MSQDNYKHADVERLIAAVKPFVEAFSSDVDSVTAGDWSKLAKAYRAITYQSPQIIDLGEMLKGKSHE